MSNPIKVIYTKTKHTKNILNTFSHAPCTFYITGVIKERYILPDAKFDNIST
jgi:hypothetical protein